MDLVLHLLQPPPGCSDFLPPRTASPALYSLLPGLSFSCAHTSEFFLLLLLLTLQLNVFIKSSENPL